MAQNNEGSYGIITFGNDGPATLIPFRVTESGSTYNTNAISYFKNDYILAKRDNKNYLYSKLGVLVASSKFDIIEFTSPYLVVKDNGYILYKMSSNGDSGTIVSNEVDYIKLLNNYFVGIKNNKLNIYSFDDGKTGIISGGVELLTKDNEYHNYEVNIIAGGFEIKIKKADNTYETYNYDMSGKLINNGE